MISIMKFRTFYPGIRPRNNTVLFHGMASLLFFATCTLAAPVSIRFEGDSTLHRFSGHVDRGTIAIQNGESGHDTVQISIPVLDISTDHAKRDQNMYKMFECPSYAEIRGTADLGMLLDATTVSIPIALTIRNQTRTIEAHREQSNPDHPGTMRLSWSVSLADFNLEAPAVMGLIHVYDEVKVMAELELAALQQTSAKAAPERN